MSSTVASNTAEDRPMRAPLAREMLIVLVVVIALKAAAWLLDPTMRTFVGDSSSYLWAAISNLPPPDRSFTYPMIIRATALAHANLIELGWLQTLFGVLLCVFVQRSLRVDLGVKPALALGVAMALAIEPGQLFFERMVMTETIGTFCFVMMVLAGIAHVRSGHLRSLLAMAVFGMLVASLRLSLLPVVLGFAPLPVLVHLLADHRRWLRAGLHLVVVIAATLFCHKAYQLWYDTESDALERSDYTHSSGRMRIGLLAPLVKPEHLARAGLPSNLVEQTNPPSSDPHQREAQIWSDTGLFMLIEQHSPHPDDSARKVAMYAFRDDPTGLLRMGISNLFDYFDHTITTWRMQDDLGTRPPDDGMIAIIAQRFGYDARGVATRSSPIHAYYASSRWYWVLLLFALPLLAVATWLRGRRSDPSMAALLALLGLGMFASHVLFSHIVSFRYLHPMAVIVAILIAYLPASRSGAPRR
ncbi:MAG: hypothetical protein HYV17_11560 [Xanthomonadales bacterium]|nr:hypothetical protein [Xanthomonadales bacterium]